MSGPPAGRQRRGRLGETAAAALLESLGYRILDRNVRLGRVEVDLVAQDGQTTVIVEVKARWGDAYGDPADAVTAAKRRHLILAAEEYVRTRGLDHRPWRIDVLALRLRGERVVHSELFRDAVEDM